MKIKWEVQPAPTGRYRSFQSRGWPIGTTDEQICFLVTCTEAFDYVPALVKTGQHPPLKLSIRDDKARSNKIRTFTREFATLKDLKAFAASRDVDKLRSILANG